jgi:hypothetical protein
MILTRDPFFFPLKATDLKVTSVTMFALKNKKRDFFLGNEKKFDFLRGFSAKIGPKLMLKGPFSSK